MCVLGAQGAASKGSVKKRGGECQGAGMARAKVLRWNKHRATLFPSLRSSDGGLACRSVLCEGARQEGLC